MSNTKTKPPVSVGMCRCQLPAQKKPPENEQLLYNLQLHKLTGGVRLTYNPKQQLLPDAKQLQS